MHSSRKEEADSSSGTMETPKELIGNGEEELKIKRSK